MRVHCIIFFCCHIKSIMLAKPNIIFFIDLNNLLWPNYSRRCNSYLCLPFYLVILVIPLQVEVKVPSQARHGRSNQHLLTATYSLVTRSPIKPWNAYAYSRAHWWTATHNHWHCRVYVCVRGNLFTTEVGLCQIVALPSNCHRKMYSISQARAHPLSSRQRPAR